MDESDWHWKQNNKKLKKEGINYELWRVWWTICATGIKRKFE